uniref:Uncharacterized protein n=1 Tax=Plectus sambesii TaxID=2011161 RepID=A0A914VLC2_9BILA
MKQKEREKNATKDACWKGTCTHFGNADKGIERDPLAGASLGCRSCQLELNEDGQAGDPHSPGLLLGIDHERYIIPKSDWLPDVEKLTVHEAAVLNYMMNHWLKSNRTEKWWDMMANLLRRVYLSTLHHTAIRPALMSVLNTEHQCEQCEFCCCEQKSILAISRIGQYRAPFDANAAQMTIEKREEKKKKIPS